MKFKLTASALVAATLLQGCGTTVSEVKAGIEQQGVERKVRLETPVQIIAPAARVRDVNQVMIPVTVSRSARKGAWLKQITVKLDIRTAVPFTAVVDQLTAQGINIASDLPMDSYTFSGRVNSTDGETALKIVLGSVGLDYQLDDRRKLVTITPLASKTWFMNIGNRKSTYTSGNQNASAGGSPAAATSSSTSNSPTAAAVSAVAAATSNTPTTTASFVGGDDFWSSIGTELKARLSVMMPRSMAGQGATATTGPTPIVPGMTGRPPVQTMAPGMVGMPSNGQAQNELYVPRVVGTYSLNPETGAVTVQAPHWLLADLDTYMKRVQEMYNTDISFSGELVLVTSNKDNSEGIDLSAFSRWASGTHGAAISNNALGGVTISLPSNNVAGAAITAGAQTVAGPLLGLTFGDGGNNTLNIFNAYMSAHGDVSVIQRPLLTTTPGAPGAFTEEFTTYYNTVTQEAVSSATGATSMATKNVLVPVQQGTDLQINPQIDISTGMIRAHISLKQALQSGTQPVVQTITTGNSSSPVNTNIPLIKKNSQAGEILLRDGDLIVLGGQTKLNQSTDENGLPGQDGPLGGIFGVKKSSRGTQTYYFAMRVTVNKRK